MKANGLVTLLTDFGYQDPYVGVMKGVMLSVDPLLKLVSLSHAVRPQAVREASFWLARAHNFFGRGTVHLVVVDPGVGGERLPVCLELGDQFFVGPDNGVFSEVIGLAEKVRARQIDVDQLAKPPSRTFHGRDIFAPTAARLASGSCGFEQIGPALDELMILDFPKPLARGTGLVGEVVTSDHFGNLLTNIPQSTQTVGLGEAQVAGRKVRVVRTYGEAEIGEIVALFGSFGTLEIAVRDGSAQQLLSLDRGALVTLC